MITNLYTIRMPAHDAKELCKKWSAALSTSKDTTVGDLGRIIFGLSSSKQKLEADFLGNLDGAVLNSKRDICIILLTSSIAANGMRSLADLEGMPNDLIDMIPKATSLGRYLPHQMMAVLVLSKQYLSLMCIHPSLPDIEDVTRLQLDSYLSFWSSVKGKGLFPCVETITFDENSESWPAFCIELMGVLIKHGLRGLFFCAKVGALALPEHLFFHSMWLGQVLCMSVNNCPLRWPMH